MYEEQKMKEIAAYHQAMNSASGVIGASLQNEVRTRSPVEQEISRLRSALDSLGGKWRHLAERLSPVTNQRPEKESAATPEDVPAGPLCSNLRDLTHMAESIERQLAAAHRDLTL